MVKAQINKPSLIIVDDEMNKFALAQLVEELGLSFEIVFNDTQAIDHLKREDFEFVLIDINTLSDNGVYFTRQIRNHSQQRISDIPIIGISSYYNKFIKSAFGAGMDIYLSRAIGLPKISKKIKKFLEQQSIN